MVKTYLEAFDDEVTAIFTTRKGGHSHSPFDENNLGLSTGDEIDLVQQNRDALFESLGFTESDVALASQVHGDRIAIIEQPGKMDQCDSLITNQLDLPLVIQVADCACVYLYDPENKAIGLVHSGWRGTQKEIVPKTIIAMIETFNTTPENLHVVISPCLLQAHFEVGSNVYDLFDPSYFVKKNDTKWNFDMRQCLIDQIYNCNVTNIVVDNSCTFENTDHYFSFRRDRSQSGRMMGVMILH